jgi:hypothetical protein
MYFTEFLGVSSNSMATVLANTLVLAVRTLVLSNLPLIPEMMFLSALDTVNLVLTML